MTPAQWRRMAIPIVGDGWRVSKFLVYRVPVGWVLNGLLAEQSRSGGFYIWQVRAPLYAPTTVLDLSWSERIGGGSAVYELDEVAASAVESAARQVVTESSAADGVVLDPPGGADNVRMQEARAYGLALQGDTSSAIEVLGRVMRYTARFPWEDELLIRAAAALEELKSGRVDDLLERISHWREVAAKSLGLDLT